MQDSYCKSMIRNCMEWAFGFEQHTVIFVARSSEVQFMILQGSARPEVRSELYEERRARI